MHLSIGAAALYLGVSISTLRRWENEGCLLPTYRTKGGHRRYCLTFLKTKVLADEEQPEKSAGKTYCYSRVSSHDQKGDLVRQTERLEQYCQSQSLDYEVISDLGSGLNFKKKGLNRLLKLICSNRVSKLVLTHKDRLLRFGSQLLFNLCSYFGTKVVILEEDKDKTFEQELVTDVLELMTVFTAKVHGKRSHKNRVKLAA